MSGRGGNGGPPGGTGDERLDEAFPLGDGTVQDTAEVACPYCGEWVSLRLDPGSGPRQSYVEDCPVCCRPWHVSVRYGADGTATVELRSEEE